jgi:surfactin synthase thioesterase subunit
MIETYRHEPDSPPPIDIPILLINGDQENITEEEAGAWQLETRGEVVLKRFSGNHFFILGQEAKVLSEIFFYYKHFCK